MKTTGPYTPFIRQTQRRFLRGLARRAGIPVAAKNVFISLREEGNYLVYVMCR